MVIPQGPSGSALLQALDSRHTPRIPPAMGLAIGVSLAVHLAAGLYVYNNRFKPMEAPPTAEGPVVVGPMIRLPPTPEESPAPKSNIHRTPTRADVRPDRTLPMPAPISDTPTTDSLTPWETLFGDGEGIKPDLPPPQPIPKVIGSPQWVSRPNGAQLTRHYPARAARLGVSGEAALSCIVNATGTVSACVVVSETPSTFGFGTAALNLSQYFRMQPRTEDGQPVDGGQVSIPIKFRIE